MSQRMQLIIPVALTILCWSQWACAQAPNGNGPPAGGPQPRVEQVSPQVQANIDLVTQFFTMVFVEHKVSEGFEKYVSKQFKENKPEYPTREAVIKRLTEIFTRENPSLVMKPARVVGQGDLVAVHLQGGGSIDVFRVANGSIVEHWDL